MRAADADDKIADAESGAPGQVDQVLAALTGLTAKFACVETTVSKLPARQVALESARVTGAAAAAAVLVESEVGSVARAEFEYALTFVARLGDVFDYFEGGGAGHVEFDLRRGSRVLLEVYILQKERLDGVFRHAAIEAKTGLDGKNDGAITGRMEAECQARMLAGDLSQADNIYAAEAAELDTDVKNRATKLLAYPLAAARVEQRHGSGFATEFSKSWTMRGGHDEG